MSVPPRADPSGFAAKKKEALEKAEKLRKERAAAAKTGEGQARAEAMKASREKMGLGGDLSAFEPVKKKGKEAAPSEPLGGGGAGRQTSGMARTTGFSSAFGDQPIDRKASATTTFGERDRDRERDFDSRSQPGSAASTARASDPAPRNTHTSSGPASSRDAQRGDDRDRDRERDREGSTLRALEERVRQLEERLREREERREEERRRDKLAFDTFLENAKRQFAALLATNKRQAVEAGVWAASQLDDAKVSAAAVPPGPGPAQTQTQAQGSQPSSAVTGAAAPKKEKKAPSEAQEGAAGARAKAAATSGGPAARAAAVAGKEAKQEQPVAAAAEKEKVAVETKVKEKGKASAKKPAQQQAPAAEEEEEEEEAAGAGEDEDADEAQPEAQSDDLDEKPVGKNTGGGMAGAFPEGPDEAPPEGTVLELFPCPLCKKKFAKAPLAKHAKICKKVFQTKRKAFKVEVIDEEDKRTMAPPPPPKKGAKGKKEEAKDEKPKVSKWRLESARLKEAIQAGKDLAKAIANGEDVSKVPVRASAVADDRVQCPHCSRKFAAESAERHIPKCTMAKPGGAKAPAKKR